MTNVGAPRLDFPGSQGTVLAGFCLVPESFKFSLFQIKLLRASPRIRILKNFAEENVPKIAPPENTILDPILDPGVGVGSKYHGFVALTGGLFLGPFNSIFQSGYFSVGQKYKKESILGTFSSALDFQKRSKNPFFQIHRHKYISTHTGPSGTKMPQNPRETL